MKKKLFVLHNFINLRKCLSTFKANLSVKNTFKVMLSTIKNNLTELFKAQS